MRFRTALAMTVLVLSSIASAGGPRIEHAKFDFQGKQRSYYIFVPQTATKAAPLILMLHGSGRDGRILLEHWQKLAEKEGIILVGPDAANSQGWNPQVDSAAFLHDLVEKVKSAYAVDGQRVYLFGHSAGASYALLLSMAESQYFAATAVHAGALRPENKDWMEFARRKIPVAVWVGDQDPFFPVSAVRSTVEELEKLDFPADLHLIRGHTHNYYQISDDVNRQAWEFLKDKRNPAPEYIDVH